MPAPDLVPDAPAMADRARSRGSEIVDALRRAGETGLSGASALPGWTRLTVACHLRYNATALIRMTREALAGRPTDMYPGGRDLTRPSTLEPAPGESSLAVVASLAGVVDELGDAWSTADLAGWSTRVRSRAGQGPMSEMPLAGWAMLRCTEVELHGTDLALGLTDWSDVFCRIAAHWRLSRLAEIGSASGAVNSWAFVTDNLELVVRATDGVVTVVPGSDGERSIAASDRDVVAIAMGRPTVGGVDASPGAIATFREAFPAA